MMKCIFVLLACLSISFASFTESEYRSAFTSWMQKHNKVYTGEDFQSRFEVFKENMDYVHQWNSRGSETVLGLTIMADMTNEEYQKIYLGTHYNSDADSKEEHNPRVVLPDIFVPLNDSLDWRVNGAVTPVKDQGQCGSCWAFSTTGSVEGANQLATGNLVVLSEQNLMDCSSNYGNQGCDGGLMTNAYQYIIANKGLDTEESYPYKMRKQSCLFSANNVGATISDYKNVPKTEAQLLMFLTKQPVSVAIDASHRSFQLYQAGVYYEPSCSTSALDHGVLAVGYGSEGASDYWIVKNSWGPNWGNQGYIYMARNKNNNCGIVTMASVPSH